MSKHASQESYEGSSLSTFQYNPLSQLIKNCFSGLIAHWYWYYLLKLFIKSLLTPLGYLFFVRDLVRSVRNGVGRRVTFECRRHFSKEFACVKRCFVHYRIVQSTRGGVRSVLRLCTTVQRYGPESALCALWVCGLAAIRPPPPYPPLPSNGALVCVTDRRRQFFAFAALLS